MILSKRKFDISTYEGDIVSISNKRRLEHFTHPQQNDFEYIYAIRDNYIDEVLDLKIGESIYFQPNRDDKMSKGIIVRIE